MRSAHLAIDLGASSGRAMLGLLDPREKKLELEEVHRFQHTPIETPTGPVWDYTGIVNEVMKGLRGAVRHAAQMGINLSSVGVDTWGVDWSVITPGGNLLGLPCCYRDPANEAAKQHTLNQLSGGAKELFQRGGIQPLPFNTLFQLVGRKQHAPELVPQAGRLQLMPDLLHYHLSGKLSNERTIASTGALLSAETADWDQQLIGSLGLPTDLFGQLVDPGTSLGELRPSLAAELGVSEPIEVVVPATHDTASAVAAVPAYGHSPETWCFLSSGTWSLLGMEMRDANTSAEALANGFTNELGVVADGKPTVRFLRNIGGLWLVQELQRDLASQGVEISFAELAKLAEEVTPFRTIVDPNAADLAAPGGSIAKLRRHAERTDQPIPQTPGELARCCYDSLAMCYAETVDRLERVTGCTAKALFIVGGGVQNQLLNRLTAAAVGRPVYAGPVEATAIGNLLLQAQGLGLVQGLNEVREIVSQSFPVNEIEPIALSHDHPEVFSRYSRVTSSPS